MAITTSLELRSLADDTEVEIEGRYAVFDPEPFGPPGRAPQCARVELDQGAVLLGKYREPEALRADDERRSHAGKRVRVRGRFHHTRPWPHDGPPPGLWHGGGPQLWDVHVEPLE